MNYHCGCGSVISDRKDNVKRHYSRAKKHKEWVIEQAREKAAAEVATKARKQYQKHSLIRALTDAAEEDMHAPDPDSFAEGDGLSELSSASYELSTPGGGSFTPAEDTDMELFGEDALTVGIDVTPTPSRDQLRARSADTSGTFYRRKRQDGQEFRMRKRARALPAPFTESCGDSQAECEAASSPSAGASSAGVVGATPSLSAGASSEDAANESDTDALEKAANEHNSYRVRVADGARVVRTPARARAPPPPPVMCERLPPIEAYYRAYLANGATVRVIGMAPYIYKPPLESASCEEFIFSLLQRANRTQEECALLFYLSALNRLTHAEAVCDIYAVSKEEIIPPWNLLSQRDDVERFMRKAEIFSFTINRPART